MLQCAADPKEDDSVRDAIHALFADLWLENNNSSNNAPAVVSPIQPSKRRAVMKDDDHDVTKISKQRKASQVERRCSIASDQMIEVVLAAGSNDQLTTLLRDLLSGFSDLEKDRRNSDRKERKEMASSHCEHLCDALIEHLLGLEEARDRSYRQKASMQKVPRPKSAIVGPMITLRKTFDTWRRAWIVGKTWSIRTGWSST